MTETCGVSVAAWRAIARAWRAIARIMQLSSGRGCQPRHCTWRACGPTATGPAAYLFLRAMLPADRPASPWLAVALAAPIPFWAAIQEAAGDFFHPENLALPFALLAAWAGLRGRRIAMWTLCVLSLACKEDQVYTFAVLAPFMRSSVPPSVSKHWRFLLYLAGGWLLVGTGLVQPYFQIGRASCREK